MFTFSKVRWARRKKWKENHATKVTKIPKTKRRKYGMQQPRMATDTLIVLFNRSLKHLSDHLPCLSACLHNTLRVNAPTESIKSITSPKIDQAITQDYVLQTPSNLDSKKGAQVGGTWYVTVQEGKTARGKLFYLEGKPTLIEQ